MDDAALVRVLERAADVVGDAQRVPEREPVRRRRVQHPADVPARHVLADDVGLRALFADVVDGDDVRMVAERTHRANLGAQPGQAGLVEILDLDQRDGNVAIEKGVVCKIDTFLGTFAERPHDPVSAASERGGRRAGDGRAARRGGLAPGGVPSPGVGARVAPHERRGAARAREGLVWILVPAGWTAHASGSGRIGHRVDRWAGDDSAARYVAQPWRSMERDRARLPSGRAVSARHR